MSVAIALLKQVLLHLLNKPKEMKDGKINPTRVHLSVPHVATEKPCLLSTQNTSEPIKQNVRIIEIKKSRGGGVETKQGKAEREKVRSHFMFSLRYCWSFSANERTRVSVQHAGWQIIFHRKYF